MVIASHEAAVKGPLHFIGYRGVDVFFAISGILICSRLLDEEKRNGSISLRNFYIKRGFRILPAAFAFLATLTILDLAKIISVSRPELISSALFFRNYIPASQSGWYTGHFWSLAVEEHFYFLLPAVVAFFPRARRWLLIALIIAVTAWRWLDYNHLHLPYGTAPQLRTDLRLDALLIAALVAITVRSDDTRAILKRALVWPVWVLIFAGFIVTAISDFHFNASVLSILITFAVLGTTLNPQQWPGRILEVAPLRWIGRISYGLYLWQQMFFAHFQPLWFQRWPLNVVILASITTVSYYFFEKPLLRFGHSLAGDRGAKPTPALAHGAGAGGD